MEPSLDKYIRAPIQQIKPEVPPTFPIYLYLVINQKYLKFRDAGIEFGFELQQKFIQRGFDRIFVHENDSKLLLTYIDHVGVYKDSDIVRFLNDTEAKEGLKDFPKLSEFVKETKVLDPTALVMQVEQFQQDKIKDHRKFLTEAQKQTREVQAALQGNLIENILSDKQASKDERAEALLRVSQAVLQSLVMIGSNDEKDVVEGLENCRKVIDEVFNVVTKGNDIYEEASAIVKASSLVRDHSVSVSALASCFAMLLGISETEELAEVSLSALFHDYGLITCSSEIIRRPICERNEEEEEAYKKAWASGVDLLRDKRVDFPKNVLIIISQVHESYDGSGYPNKLHSEEISPHAEVIALANTFDNLLKGRMDGKTKTPQEALNLLLEGKLPSGFLLQSFNPITVSKLASLLIL